MSVNEQGHHGKYSGNSRHTRVTSHNFAATRRDDQAHMQYLKEVLDVDLYDKVRVCLGLEPLNVATEKGMQQSEKILNK